MNPPDPQTAIQELELRKVKLEQLRKLQYEVSALETLVFDRLPQASEIITACVSRRFQVPIKLLMSRDQRQSTVLPRQLIFFIMRRLTACCLKDIGKMFARDHGTVIHACRAISDRIDTDQHFAAIAREIEAECSSAIAATQAQPDQPDQQSHAT